MASFRFIGLVTEQFSVSSHTGTVSFAADTIDRKPAAIPEKPG
nr:hypothetical protein [Xenorhabdus thuongxuanensis]